MTLVRRLTYQLQELAYITRSTLASCYHDGHFLDVVTQAYFDAQGKIVMRVSQDIERSRLMLIEQSPEHRNGSPGYASASRKLHIHSPRAPTCPYGQVSQSSCSEQSQSGMGGFNSIFHVARSRLRYGQRCLGKFCFIHCRNR